VEPGEGKGTRGYASVCSVCTTIDGKALDGPALNYLHKKDTVHIHPSSGEIASYVARTCSPVVKTAVEEHCLACEDCQATVIIMLRLVFEEMPAEEQQAIESQREALHEAVIRFLRLYRRIAAWASALHIERPV
jgi:hypothetical protein